MPPSTTDEHLALSCRAPPALPEMRVKIHMNVRFENGPTSVVGSYISTHNLSSETVSISAQSYNRSIIHAPRSSLRLPSPAFEISLALPFPLTLPCDETRLSASVFRKLVGVLNCGVVLNFQ